jgi:hypothetical protein
LADKAKEIGIQPYIITSSDKESIEVFKIKYNLPLEHFYADAVVIKTMIRANPGIVYLNNGTVKGKWSHNAVPTIDKIKSLD